MAEFKDTMLTKQGRSLLAKAMAGTLLRFTRMQAGAGLPDGGVDGMTALIAPRLEGEIFSVSSAGNGGCFIKGRFSNTGLSQSFRMCEIGVFAEDPEVGEILYCYTSVQDVDKADFMGADTGNPGGLLEEEITIGAYISNAANVTANITRSAWAREIGYDNSVSGLNSTELQGAIDALACSHVIEIPILHGLDCHPKVVAIETAYGFGMKGFGSSGFGGESEYQEIKCRGIYLNRNSMKVAMEKKYEGTPTLQRISDGEFVFRFPNIALIVSLISDYATMNRAIQGISALLATGQWIEHRD